MPRTDAIEEIDLDDFLGDSGSKSGGSGEPDLDDFLDQVSTAPSPQGGESAPQAGDRAAEQGELKTRIACYYLNKQLEESLLRLGGIPETPVETIIGVGFIDIVDYTYISSWLSPKENQLLLSGLYTAFHLVLKRRGGFLNKISGDSMMFHFGGTIDPAVQGLEPQAAQAYIARALFSTCVEIQESCRLFNRADEEFIPPDADGPSKRAMSRAFDIVRNLRANMAEVISINAMFQVRIRIGASMGEVCIGNFGPEGARQWDVIGNPVIEARRMESTAPVDGIRLTESLHLALYTCGAEDEYLKAFRAKASGFYQGIEMHELFRAVPVILQEKRGAVFDSCAVQANADLPEDVWRLIESYLDSPDGGIPDILELLRYYRGNRLVIEAVEELFRERGIVLRKADIYAKLLPGRYSRLLRERRGDEAGLRADLERGTSLYQLFRVLGRYQDRFKVAPVDDREEEPFQCYEQRMRYVTRRSEEHYMARRLSREQQQYFHEILFPYFFGSIEASIMEYLAGRSARGGQSEGD